MLVDNSNGIVLDFSGLLNEIIEIILNIFFFETKRAGLKFLSAK